MAHHIRTALVSLLAIALLAWFLRGANIRDVAEQVRHANLALILASVLIVAVIYVVRTVRWQYVLQPVGPTRFRTAFRTTIIGFAASFILPARAGEVLRPYLLARQDGLSATAAFATVVVERVLDMIAVLALLSVFVWAPTGPSTSPLLEAVKLSAAAAGLVAAGLMGVMWVLASHPGWMGRAVLKAGAVLPVRIAQTLSKLARTFSEGLAVSRAPRALVLASVWSVLLWVLIAAQIWLVTRAFGIAMPFTGSFLLQALLVVGLALPTPGGVGGFHEAYRLGTTTFFAADNDAAIGAALVLHAASFIPITIAGLVMMTSDGLSLRRLPDAIVAPQTGDLRG